MTTLSSMVLLFGLVVALFVGASEATGDAHTLPIFFFHGITGTAMAGYYMQQNLSTDARPFISLNFCESACSLTDLPSQTALAIAQIRSIVANDTRFDCGYVFIGHSQGGAIARAVIEEMDDHKVHTLISLAGAQNGIFYGPQASDLMPAILYLKVFGPMVVDPAILDLSNYTIADIQSGRLQVDNTKVQIAHPELQDVSSVYNLNRSPYKSAWINYNTFYPVVNNLRKKTSAWVLIDQLRRKRNFLKLKAAHFFASPKDETISPWQSSIFGQYNDVSSVEELESTFLSLKVIPMTETDEYKQDTFGLKTLDKRGGLFLHTIEGVGHVCWLADSIPYGSTETCVFKPVYEKSTYPLVAPK